MSGLSEANAWHKGFSLAIRLLKTCNDAQLGDVLLTTEYRKLRPQVNIVHGHMLKLRALNDETADRAFAAVLTDVLGSVLGSGVVSSDSYYGQFAQRPVKTITATKVPTQKEVSHG